MTVNLHYAIDNAMVAGLGLSMILVHSLGGSLLYGFNAGYSTFASRAFSANNHTKYNSYFLQGLLNLAILLILLTALGLLTYQLCIFTGQQPDVAEIAHRFYVLQLPGLWCFFIGDFLRNRLNSQAIFQPLFYTNAMTCLFHILVSAVLSRDGGFTGIVWSTNLTFLMFLLLVGGVTIKYSKWALSWQAISKGNWSEDYTSFFRECSYVAVPNLLDLFMFEFMALYVGSYQVVEQTAAHVNFSSYATINGGIISGYASACMIKAGHQAGINNPVGLRLIIRRALVIGMASFLCQYSFTILFRTQIFGFFT